MARSRETLRVLIYPHCAWDFIQGRLAMASAEAAQVNPIRCDWSGINEVSIIWPETVIYFHYTLIMAYF